MTLWEMIWDSIKAATFLVLVAVASALLLGLWLGILRAVMGGVMRAWSV